MKDLAIKWTMIGLFSITSTLFAVIFISIMGFCLTENPDFIIW